MYDFIFVKRQDVAERAQSLEVQLLAHGLQPTQAWRDQVALDLAVLRDTDDNDVMWAFGEVGASCAHYKTSVCIIPKSNHWDEMPPMYLPRVEKASARLEELNNIREVLVQHVKSGSRPSYLCRQTAVV